MNAHGNQGVTADHAIGVIDSRETNLANAKLFLVQITRARDGLELVVDNRDRVAAAITRHAGEKTSALETIGEIGRSPNAEAVRNAVAGRNQPAPAPPMKSPEPAVSIPVREHTRDRQMDLGL